MNFLVNSISFKLIRELKKKKVFILTSMQNSCLIWVISLLKDILDERICIPPWKRLTGNTGPVKLRAFGPDFIRVNVGLLEFAEDTKGCVELARVEEANFQTVLVRGVGWPWKTKHVNSGFDLLTSMKRKWTVESTRTFRRCFLK